MGEYRDAKNVRCYEPDNDEKTLYVRRSEISLADLNEMCKSYFPTASLDDLNIEGMEIHTRCLGYDLYDRADHTNYIVVSWNKSKNEKA